MYNIFHNLNEVKRWPEVAGNYPESRSDPQGGLQSDLRRPAMYGGGAGGAWLVLAWASKPSKVSEL